MAAPADGNGSVVPLALYPPGFDLSRFLIYDPAVGDWLSGATYIRPAPAPLLSRPMPQDGPDPDDPDPSGPPSSGFFRVFHIPDWAFEITNYSYASTWFLPIDFADYRDLVDNVQVLINGDLSPFAEYMPYVMNGQTNWGVSFDFDRLTNGTHQIQLVTTLRLNDEIGEDSVFLVLTNLTKSIVVFNQATFPDWNEFIQGDTYTFNAQLANPNTDWSIDIYDALGDWVNYGSGHTTNGQVSWTWDLYDWWGYNRDDFANDPYFFSEITFNTLGNGPQTVLSQPPSPKGYPDRGQWLISYQDRWYSDATAYPSDCQTKYAEAMAYIRGGPQLVGETAYLVPLKFGTNVYSQSDREQTWTNLLAAIGNLNYRNLYYHGHGNKTSIGCDRHVFATNGTWTSGTTTSRNSKSQMASWQVSQQTRYNRYRFVFLDGCSTAAGDWPNAFNISKTNHTIQFYENHPKHPRPSAFVGWNEPYGNEPGTSVYKWLNFEKNWMGIWANDSDHPDIKTSLERANSVFGWLDAGVFNSKIRFYGYQEMKIRDYNGKNDWRWP